MVKQVLNNGLTVLVEERPGSPVAAIVTHVKTGYFDEPDKWVGISHIFEHMFFKGTTRRPGPEDIAQETKALGGVLNAGTSYEATTYYVTVPSDNFERALDIQFDALTDPLLNPSELQREAEVVIQEARQKLDSPSAFSLEKMWELSFDRHRIRRWRIGYPDALREITRDDLWAYYHSRYSPQNIILSIVGGVESGAALQTAERLYSEIPVRDLVQDPSPEEPEQLALKYLRLRGDINRKLVHIGFHAPPVLAADYYPLSIAVDILGEGKSSRLYQSLMEQKQLVSSIGSFYSAYGDVGVVTVSAEALAVDLRDVSVAVLQEMEKLKKEPIRRAELDKIKNRIETDLQMEQEHVLGRANRLAYFEALGDWRMSDEFIDRLRRVEADDVARAAAQYLRLDGSTVLEYVPETAELPEYDSEELTRAASEAVVHVPPALPITTVTTDTNLRRAVLPSRAVLITDVDESTPVVGLTIYFKGGRLCEVPDVAGVSELALRSSLKGTAKFSAAEIAHRIEALGTSIGTSNGSDFLGYSLRILDKNFDEGFQLLSDIITEPTFPEEEVAKERDALLADIRLLRDSSFGYASELLTEVAFPGHPYSLPDYGREETVADLTRDQVAQWHWAMCAAETAVVSVVGNVHIDTVTKAVEELFERLGAKPVRCPVVPAVFPGEIRENSVERDRAQTAAAMGFPGVAADDPGRYSLDVTAAVTSGLGGRLFAEVRGRLGLAYVVSSANQSAASGGMFVIYTATSPENEQLAREAIFDELHKLRQQLADVEEVERAKSYLKGAKLISLQTSVARARELAANEIYGRGMQGTDDYLSGIAKVTPEDVLNACRQHLSSTRYCLGAVRGRRDGRS
ncbi:MAG: insulinase family protein [Armatimonadetes bacterium]|nr:insulinase family protein [Armatimonadota bacterium]